MYKVILYGSCARGDYDNESDVDIMILLNIPQDGFYTAANNRAYYSVFHAIRSILVLDQFDSKKHSVIISKFRETYIKTGIIPDKVSDGIKETFEVRQD